MALTPSTMLPLGTPAPPFSLPDTAGRVRTNEEFAGMPLLVMFICNHCPYVKHVAPELKRLGDEYMGGGSAAKRVAVVAISSNDAVAHPEDAPEKMKEEVDERGYGFPYLYDADQSVAKAFTAACTPDFFLFDADHRLVYRGQLDETRPHRVKSGVYDARNGQADGATLRAAIDEVLEGRRR